MAIATQHSPDAWGRVNHIFKFLAEFHRIKLPPDMVQDNYSWLLNFDQIPRAKSISVGAQHEFLRSMSVARKDASTDSILHVGRTRDVECPLPSVIFAKWLNPGWEQMDHIPTCKTEKKVKGVGSVKHVEHFSDSLERVEAFEDWMRGRDRWVQSEQSVFKAHELFSDLFSIWGDIQRESEKYQLVIADGILTWDSPYGKVSHPILLQRVNLSFDTGKPEFTVHETDDNPEIFSPLLRFLGVEGRQLNKLREIVTEENVHPLGGDNTGQFLKQTIQSLWDNGVYFEDLEHLEPVEGPSMHRRPVMYLGTRIQDFAHNMERYVSAMPQMSHLPESLVRIAGIDTKRETVILESMSEEEDEIEVETEILLTKPANPEQERVIRQLEDTGAVLVQGPPGTGKSHTIANLIGHLLAQKKSILITSHSAKALRVVREHVVEPLQSLCVSLLENDDESTKQLEESVTGILNYLSKTTAGKLKKEIESLALKRQDLLTQCQQKRQEIYQALASEYTNIDLCGTSASPADIARQLTKQRDVDGWIPGPLTLKADLPLSEDDLNALYRINHTITTENEPFMTAKLPALETLPEPGEFTELFDELAVVEKKNTRIGAGYWQHEEQSYAKLKLAMELLSCAVEAISSDKEWILDCMQLGCASQKDQSLRRTWDTLLDMIDSCARDIPAKQELILAYDPQLRSDKTDKALLATCNQIIAKISVTKGQDLKARNIFFKPEWKDFVQHTQVDDGAPEKLHHFEAIRNLLQSRIMRAQLSRYWEQCMGDYSDVSETHLGNKPERTAHRLSVSIRAALDWYENRWKPCEATLQDLGFDQQLQWQLAQDTQGFSKLQTWVREEMQPVFNARLDFIRHRDLKRSTTQWITYFDGYSRSDVVYPLIKRFRKSIKDRDYDSYLRTWHELQDFIAMRPDYEKREQYLEQMETVAKTWADALRQHEPPHDQKTPPGNIMDAWRFRQWDQILTSMGDNDLDKLQAALIKILDRLQDITGKYVEKLSWLSQVERTGLKQQQALNGWLELQKKMGRGKGKHVNRLKQEAKKTLLECRQAVPVWIMPTAQVFESFDLATTRFDVVIIDEASQSDLRGLGVLALGREVVVVGDHEQVSPYGIGQQTDKIQELIDEHLDHIPNKQLYDGRTSIYDLARQSFGGTIRLVEHFRCVPDIIQFSNHLCYNGEIQALRESSTSKITPPLIVHHVPGGQSVDKVNRLEGEVVASLIVSLCRFPEYDKCTLGVISMVGVEQARFIDSILRRRLSVSEYEKRRILCGNASQFQGDERDVIFLSLVDSPKAKVLSMRQSSEAKKVYNVAASRAKDQLWLVHSLDPERDLKEGDLRLRLIKHVTDPSGLRRKTSQDKVHFKSEFHKAVWHDLRALDYQVTAHYELGHHVMDLVVEGKNGKRLAIQCDGDYERSVEQLPIEVDRQLTLERLDWKMVRLRVSEYYLNPEGVIKKLRATLKRAKIEAQPIDSVETVNESDRVELQANVIKKAKSIRIRWKPTAT